MAQNVKFIRGDTAKINSTAIADGQLLWNTATGEIWEDVGTGRVSCGRLVANTLAEALSITEEGIPCGTLVVKELNRRASNNVFTFTSLDSSKYTIYANIFNGVIFVDASVLAPTMDAGSIFTIGTINEWCGAEISYCPIISIGQNIMSAILRIESNGTVNVTSQGAIPGNNWLYGKSATFVGYGFI